MKRLFDCFSTFIDLDIDGDAEPTVMFPLNLVRRMRGANTVEVEYKLIERASTPARGYKSESIQRCHRKLPDACSRDSSSLVMMPKCTIAMKNRSAVVHRMVEHMSERLQ